MDPDLAERLVEAGVDPGRPTDPRDAWMRLQSRFGRRATLIDRYALEAEHLGIAPDDLPGDDRARLAQEVLEIQYPGLELLGTGDGDPVGLVPYDDSWPGSFVSWSERLAAALGSAAVSIQHFGSTAVAGLAAKPVIDVLVAVPDVEDESAYVPDIEALGFQLRAREPDHRYFRPPAGSPREVHIHACDAGGRWEREHLLFRDFLRAQADKRNEYAALKTDLAMRYRLDRLAYTEAKTGFILDSLEAAFAWAKETNWTAETGLAV